GVRRRGRSGTLNALLDPQRIFELLLLRQDRVELGKLRRQLLRLASSGLCTGAGYRRLRRNLPGAVCLGITTAYRQCGDQCAETTGTSEHGSRTAEQPVTRTGNVIFHSHSPVLCLCCISSYMKRPLMAQCQRVIVSENLPAHKVVSAAPQ